MMKRLLLNALAVTAALAGIAVSDASAQDKPLAFGPPLRPNIVFSYKFTERVRAVYESQGQVVDSGQRVLTYYVSQKQEPMTGGRWQIEANIDSMRVEYVHNGETLHFNTQDAATEQFDINHREILGPSAIVNRVAMITLSPYGEVLNVESPSFEFLKEQIAAPGVDAVTRERVVDLISPEFLSAAVFPWRSVAPLGRTVGYSETLRVPFVGVLDRIAVRDTAEVTLTRHNGKATLGFTSDFGHTARKLAAFTELLEPVSIASIDGSISGALTLDDDGVVVSGWTTAKGTINGVVSGAPLVATVWHETFTEMIGMMSLNN
jgi:hypothetical protein